MEVATLRNIIFVLLGLVAIWTIRILVKKETENIIRALLFAVFLIAVLIYLQHTGFEKITWGNIRGQVKETFFPEKLPNYVYEKEENYTAGKSYVRYAFTVPGPPLSVVLDSEQKYFRIKDIRSVNRILEYLHLPKVQTAVEELAAITGSANDISLYRWTKYPLGVLTIERGICQDKDRLDSYQCISRITIQR
jgi:hypothetical protein